MRTPGDPRSSLFVTPPAVKIAVVPMKPLAEAKARLAGALVAGERRALSLAMLRDVIEAAQALDDVWVLCSDHDAAEAAERAGARAVPDPAPGGGLNASVDAAAARAAQAGARGVLVVAADLPAVHPEDVRALAQGEGVAVAPSRDGTGTNALWRLPPLAVRAAFGPGSRAAHERLAREAGVPFRLVQRQGLALDVDAPEDLAAARDRAGAHTAAWLATRSETDPAT